MDRVSGWYKRNTQFWLLLVGIFLALSLNLDSIEITSYLSNNKVAREQLAQLGVAAASNQTYNPKTDSIVQEARDTIKASINKVNTVIGLGWGDYGRKDKKFIDYLKKDTAKWLANHLTLVYDKSAVYYEIKKVSDSIPVALYNRYGFYLRWNYIYSKTNWKKLSGFFITALAISLGAPFWFDLLNKFVSIRTAVKSINSSGSTTRNNDITRDPEIDG